MNVFSFSDARCALSPNADAGGSSIPRDAVGVLALDSGACLYCIECDQLDPDNGWEDEDGNAYGSARAIREGIACYVYAAELSGDEACERCGGLLDSTPCVGDEVEILSGDATMFGEVVDANGTSFIVEVTMSGDSAVPEGSRLIRSADSLRVSSRG